MPTELSVYELEVEYSEELPEREALGSITFTLSPNSFNNVNVQNSFNG